jgi:hypothetical protein
LVFVIASAGEAESETYTCRICGFVMHEVGEYRRCKLIVEVTVKERRSEMQALMDEIGAFLPEDVGEPGNDE